MTLAQDLGGVVLLPCPGCGDTATRVIGGPGTRGGPQHWAGCDHCRWRTWGNTEAEAIAAWNHRAPDRDGERYRWLRENRLPPAGERQPAAWIAGRGNEHIECDWLCYEAADTAIDSAMQQGGGGGE